MSIVFPYVSRLIDDAAIFPPGNLDLVSAVSQHLATRSASDELNEITGPFVVDVERSNEAVNIFRQNVSAVDFDVSVIVRPPHGLEDVFALALSSPGLDLVGIEVVVEASGQVLEKTLRSFDDAIARTGLHPKVWIEFSDFLTRESLTEDLAILKRHGYNAKIRTGGTVAELFPTPEHLALAISTCSRIGLSFKCTAGLHSAVRHTDDKTGFVHHGFLNILVATIRAQDGASDREIVAVLSSEDEDIITQAYLASPETKIEAARELFHSFGSCSIQEPLEDLTRLGLEIVREKK